MQNKLTQQQKSHLHLLDGFTTCLENLAAVQLHPAIQAAMQGYLINSSSASNSIHSATVTNNAAVSSFVHNSNSAINNNNNSSSYNNSSNVYLATTDSSAAAVAVSNNNSGYGATTTTTTTVPHLPVGYNIDHTSSMNNTLYDCIPVEREKVYLIQCKENHRKVCCLYYSYRYLYITLLYT